MNKYAELSDFEINKKVASHVLNGYYIASEEKQEVYLTTMDGGDFLPIAYFDPCNNPSNAMVIIIENRISLRNRYEGDWKAETEWGMSFESINKNPLRACMEVFLMVKDEESSND